MRFIGRSELASSAALPGFRRGMIIALFPVFGEEFVVERWTLNRDVGRSICGLAMRTCSSSLRVKTLFKSFGCHSAIREAMMIRSSVASSCGLSVAKTKISRKMLTEDVARATSTFLRVGYSPYRSWIHKEPYSSLSVLGVKVWDSQLRREDSQACFYYAFFFNASLFFRLHLVRIIMACDVSFSALFTFSTAVSHSEFYHRRQDYFGGESDGVDFLFSNFSHWRL